MSRNGFLRKIAADLEVSERPVKGFPPWVVTTQMPEEKGKNDRHVCRFRRF